MLLLELNTTKYTPIAIQSQHIVAITSDYDEHGYKLCKIYDVAGNCFLVRHSYEEILEKLSYEEIIEKLKGG